MALLVAGAIGGGSAVAASGRTYVPNCGNTSYLRYKPGFWSSGCTAGSLNMPTVRWSGWGGRAARGSGTAALREPCSPESCAEAGTYEAKARLALSRPRTCRDRRGRSHRYFSRARLTVRYRAGNPFRERPGWRSHLVTVKPADGTCRLGT